MRRRRSPELSLVGCTVAERRAHGDQILALERGENFVMFGSRKNELAQPVVERRACRPTVMEHSAVSGSSATPASSGDSGSLPGSPWTTRRFARSFANVQPLRMRSPILGGTAQLYWELRSAGHFIRKAELHTLAKDQARWYPTPSPQKFLCREAFSHDRHECINMVDSQSTS